MSDQNTILPDILTDETKIFILSAVITSDHLPHFLVASNVFAFANPQSNQYTIFKGNWPNFN